MEEVLDRSHESYSKSLSSLNSSLCRDWSDNKINIHSNLGTKMNSTTTYVKNTLLVMHN